MAILKIMQACLLVGTLGLSVLSYADVVKPSRPPQDKTFTGKITNIDRDEHTITVVTKKREMTFIISSAKVKGYQTTRGIKVGDKVMVVYEMRGDKAYAKEITKRIGRTTSKSRSYNFGFFSFRRS